MHAVAVAAPLTILLSGAVVLYALYTPQATRGAGARSPSGSHNGAAPESFWGATDAEFDWCEGGANGDHVLVLEPMNTISSFVYPILALVAWRCRDGAS